MLPLAAANAIVHAWTGQSVDLGSSSGVLLLAPPLFSPRKVRDPLPAQQDPLATGGSTAPAPPPPRPSLAGPASKTNSFAGIIGSRRRTQRSQSSRGGDGVVLKDLEEASSLDAMLPYPPGPNESPAPSPAPSSFQLAAVSMSKRGNSEPLERPALSMSASPLCVYVCLWEICASTQHS